MRKQFVCFMVLLALGGNCEEAPDFSAAFDAMWSLGAAEFKEAVLVNAEPQIDRDSGSRDILFQMRDMTSGEGIWPRLQGVNSQPDATHWLIESNRAGRITLLGTFGQVTEGYDASVVKQAKAGENLPSFKIKICDLKQDVDLVESALDKTLKEKEEQAGKKRRTYRLSMMPQNQSQLLYALTAMYKAGHKEDAGRLTQKLLQSSDTPEKIIVGVISQMGMQQYQTIMRELQGGGGTFAATVKRIDDLLERFGEEWKGYAAVKSIRDDMAKYDSTKPPVEIQGLSATEQQIAADLVTGISITNQFERDIFELCGSPAYNWLYDALAAAKAGERSVVLRIVGGGMKSIPLLAALCEDQTLTTLMRGGEGGFSSRRMIRHSFSSDSGDGEMQRRDLPAPVTRGEVAVALLSGVVPQAGGQDNPYAQRGSVDADPAEVKKSALAFYNANKDKPLVDLAFSQLKDAERVNEAAFLFVAKTSRTDEDLSKKLEALLLEKLGRGDEGGSSYSMLSLMQVYCRIKGEAASDFVRQAGVKLGLEVEGEPPVEKKEEQAKDDDQMYVSKSGSDDHMKKYKEQIYKSLKQMTAKKGDEKVKPGDFKTVLDEWGTKKIDMENYMELASTAQDISLMISGGAEVASMYGDVLDAALKVQDVNKRSNYIILMSFMMLAERMKDMPDGMFGFGGRSQERSELETLLSQSEEKKDAQPKQLEFSSPTYEVSTHAEKWRKLMQDERPFPDMFGQGSESGVETMGDMMMMMACQMSYTDGLHSLMGLPPKRISKLLRVASEHILSGKEPAEFKWPESDALGAAEVDQLAARVKKLKPDEVDNFLEQAISDSEYLAMASVVAKDKTLIPLLAPYAAEVRSVDVATNVADTVANVTKKFKNQKMSATLLKQAHKAICRDVDLAKGQDTTITLMRSRGWLNGWSMKSSAGANMYMSSLKDMLEDEVDFDEAKQSKTIFVSFTIDGDQCLCQLTPDGVLSRIKGEEFAGIKGEQQADLWKALDSAINSLGEQREGGYVEPVMITLYLP
ncbi:MAG: hypothetical protein PHO37_15950 [Kiritimatiellae bacterium]|nr:hypothetical protein [Kiritimatiellia bacterium]